MRRAAIYLFFDPSGIVDDYILNKLSALRADVDHILVVSNSPFGDEARSRIESVADAVFERENVGFDVWAYKEALEVLGKDFLSGFDELILLNYTFFGPVGSFSPMLEEMAAQPEIDFWGITDHEAAVHPAAPDHPLPQHIQSHWIAVRRSMFTSEAWSAYWRDMPMIESYIDSIVRHEGRFTQHFRDAGFIGEVAFPAADYPTGHPIAESTVAMLRDGCPIVKRRSFFSDPLYLEGRGINTRLIARTVAEAGFDMESMYSNLARTSEPRVLATNLGLVEVLSDHDLALDPPSLRTAAVGHASDVDGFLRLLAQLAHVPPGARKVVTVTGQTTADAVAADASTAGVELRIVPPTYSDVAALLIACRDLIESDDLDLLLRLHAVRPARLDQNVAGLQEQLLFASLAGSPAYLRNLIRLFERHTSLGMVFPPPMHLGMPTLGRGWRGTRESALTLAKQLGITVPFDKATPLAAYGRMFAARPAALRPLLEVADEADDDVIERLLAYAALDQGLHVREVLHPEAAAIEYSNLQFKYQILAAELPPRPAAQVNQVRSDRKRRAERKRR